MTALASPIHVASIDGVDVRFFDAPRDWLELPWHAVDDLYSAMKLPADLKQALLRQSRAFPGVDVETVPTATGPVAIQSHVMGQALYDAAREVGIISRLFEGEYLKAAMAAMDVQHHGLPTEERFRCAVLATHNSLGASAKPAAYR